MSVQSPSPTLWRRYLNFPLIWKMVIALAGGVAAGLGISALGVQDATLPVLNPMGEVFLRLLQMVIFPLIVTTLIVGVTSISPKRLGRIGTKIVGFYLVTSGVAVTIGLVIALAVSPGTGLRMPGEPAEAADVPAVSETLLNIIPANPFEALTEGNVLAVMFCALLFGLAMAFMTDSEDDRARELANFMRRGVEGAMELVFKVINGILQYAPFGVFALIAVVMAETGFDAVGPLLKLTGVVYGAIILQMVVYVVLMLGFRVKVGKFLVAAKDPVLTGFVTRSSSGTLPVTTRAAERMGVKEGVYGFTLPLGAAINMDGTAIYVGAATVFVANITGVELTLGQIATVVLIGVLASIGTAGVPGAGLLMLSMTITSVGLPMAPVALVAGIDAILDMARTAGNVAGDLVGTRLVAGSEEGMFRDPDDPDAPGPEASEPEGAGSSGGGVSGAEETAGQSGPDSDAIEGAPAGTREATWPS